MSELRRRGGGDRLPGDDDDKAKHKRGISLETFDLYQKVQREEAVQTSTGAGVSIVAYIVIALLVLSELYGYFVPKIQEHMLVDSVIEGRLRIDFDITFPALHCGEVNLDAMDVAGEQQNGIDHDITKTRLDADGVPVGSSFAVRIVAKNATEAEDAPLPADYCGSCYGAGSREGQCCNTCEEVRVAYAEKGWDSTDVLRDSEQCKREAKDPNGMSRPGEGCRIAGLMYVNKVAGNFHIAMGETHARGAGHIHQFNPTQILKYNVTHVIHKLSFGEQLSLTGSSGASSYTDKGPLDGVRQSPLEGAGVYMYYVKVIPTVYSRGRGEANMTTNQYSVTRQYRPAIYNGQRQNVLPGVFFVYDVSPFMVLITAHTAPLISVVTNLCAILGGVIAAATLADQVLYRLTRAAKGAGKDRGGADGYQPLPAGGAQGALVDALAGAVTQVQRAASAVQYGGSPGQQFGYAPGPSPLRAGPSGGYAGGAGGMGGGGGGLGYSQSSGLPSATHAGAPVGGGYGGGGMQGSSLGSGSMATGGSFASAQPSTSAYISSPPAAVHSRHAPGGGMGMGFGVSPSQAGGAAGHGASPMTGGQGMGYGQEGLGYAPDMTAAGQGQGQGLGYGGAGGYGQGGGAGYEDQSGGGKIA